MAESNRNATNGEPAESLETARPVGEPARQEGEPAESLETAHPVGEPARQEGELAESLETAHPVGEPARQEGEPAESLETARPVGEPAELLKPARQEGKPAESLETARPVGIRHEHRLCLYNTLQVYKCSGCKERGNRFVYKCQDMDSVRCDDFSLHKDCAELQNNSTSEHRPGCCFKFRPKTRAKRVCNACHKLLGGYVFESEKPHIMLHPLCMTLPLTLKSTNHQDHQLKLLTKDKGKPFTCCKCDTTFRSGGWRYRCQQLDCKASMDVSCAKEDIYGLPDFDPEKVEHTACGFMGSSAIKWFFQEILTGFVQGLGTYLCDRFSDATS